MDLFCLSELLEMLAAQPLGYKPEPGLRPIVSAVEALAAQIAFEDGGEEDKKTNGKQGIAKAAAAVARAIGEATGGKSMKKGQINKSDVGKEAKRRKLTAQQRKRGKGGSEYPDLEEDVEDCSWTMFLASFLEMSGASNKNRKPPPSDCDCGNPHKTQGGRHVCRYFGTFCCPGCNNRWTSAYTWKGEKQACRKCEMESLPHKTDPLDGSGGSRVGNNINGAHDCSRCSKCRKLGADCTGGRGTWSN